MTPTWLKPLQLAVIPLKGIRKAITLWANGDDDTEPELLTRELRRVLTVVCELDDEWEGC